MLRGVLPWVAVRVHHDVTADDLGVALVPWPVEPGDEITVEWQPWQLEVVDLVLSAAEPSHEPSQPRRSTGQALASCLALSASGARCPTSCGSAGLPSLFCCLG